MRNKSNFTFMLNNIAIDDIYMIVGSLKCVEIKCHKKFKKYWVNYTSISRNWWFWLLAFYKKKYLTTYFWVW